MKIVAFLDRQEGYRSLFEAFLMFGLLNFKL